MNNIAVFTEIIGTVVFGALLFVLWAVQSKPHRLMEGAVRSGERTADAVLESLA